MTARTGLIVNALSQRNRGREGRAVPANVHQCVLKDMAQLDGYLAEFRQTGIETLIIDGGDGTVQAILTALFADQSDWRPRLAILPGGMTNLIAHDVGVKGDPDKAVARLAAEGGAVETRPVMRVLHDDRRHCGMFFAAGAPLSTIQLCRREIHSRGFQASMAVGVTLAFVAARRALDPTREDEIFRPYHLSVHPPKGEADPAPKLLFMAATTERLMVGANPFWGGGGPVKATWARYPAKRFMRRLPGLFVGRGPKNDDVYHSQSGARFVLETGEPFILDGEIYEAPDDGELVIEHAGDAEFVR